MDKERPEEVRLHVSLLSKIVLLVAFVHHLVWAVIGVAVLVVVVVVARAGGPGPLLPSLLPTGFVKEGQSVSEGLEQLSDEQKSCVEGELGAARLAVLTAGEEPTAAEFSQVANACF